MAEIRTMKVSEALYEHLFQQVTIRLCDECKCLFLPEEVVQRSQSNPGSSIARVFHLCKDCARKEGIHMPEVTGGKFPTGRLVMTTHLQEVLTESDPEGWQEDLDQMVVKPVMGDWGEELGEEDKKINDQALESGGRLLSAYRSKNGVKVWIITEADRSYTTCLLPEDY